MPPASLLAVAEAESMVTALDAGLDMSLPLPGGGGIREASDLAGLMVRQALTGDRAALEAMFGRCSRETAYRRFHGYVTAIPAGYLAEALAGVPEHFALVVTDGPGVVALASCREGEPGGAAGRAATAAGGDAPAGAELGILVEDGWQRCGLGWLLLRRLIEHADSRGLSILHAQVLEEQAWIDRLLGAFGKCSTAFRSGTREIVLQRERTGQ
jgi:GNAT superfamily N-acetyltransferase